MKQLLLLLFTFCELSMWGQKTSVSTFDFTYPTKLNPQISISNNLTSIDVSTSVFTAGKLSLSFQKGRNQYLGAQYITNSTSDPKEYFLKLCRGCSMTISGMEGVTLDSVKFEVEKDMYDINLSENMPGTLSEDRYKRFWSKNEGQVVNAISFYNSGIASEIKKITVYYKEPISIISPIDILFSAIIFSISVA